MINGEKTPYDGIFISRDRDGNIQCYSQEIERTRPEGYDYGDYDEYEETRLAKLSPSGNLIDFKFLNTDYVVNRRTRSEWPWSDTPPSRHDFAGLITDKNGRQHTTTDESSYKQSRLRRDDLGSDEIAYNMAIKFLNEAITKLKSSTLIRCETEKNAPEEEPSQADSQQTIFAEKVRAGQSATTQARQTNIRS